MSVGLELHVGAMDSTTLLISIGAIIGFILIGFLFFGIGFDTFKNYGRNTFELRSHGETRQFGFVLMLYGCIIWVSGIVWVLYPFLILIILCFLMALFFWLIGIFVLLHPGAISEHHKTRGLISWGYSTGICWILFGVFPFLMMVLSIFFPF